MKQLTGKAIAGLLSLALIGALLFLGGCEKNTTSPPTGELGLSKAASEGLVSGWQTLRSVSTVNEVNKMVGGDVPVEKTELGGIYSGKQLRREIAKMRSGMDQALADKGFRKITGGDSLIWFIDWTDPVTGISVRKALYYNDSTGHARYYEAIYQFPAQVQLQYDSTEIRADLNFTLNDTTDDKFLSIYKLTLFRPGFYVDKIEANAYATDYGANNEVTGAILHNMVWYGQQNELEKLTQELEINPDESGHANERLDYRDGTYLQRTIDFYADYTGEFSEVWRDGTTVTGTFDRIENDNHGSFTRTINFPSGHDPVKIDEAADITLNPADSSSSLILKEKILFASGQLDTSRLDVDEYWENGLKKTHLEAWSSDGSHADLMVTHYAEYEELEGNYTSPEGYYVLINGTFYNDGSGELWLKIYESEQAYLNGDPPLVIIYIHFNPDGSGEGTITEGSNTYKVVIGQNGKMVVSNNKGESKVVNGF